MRLNNRTNFLKGCWLTIAIFVFTSFSANAQLHIVVKLEIKKNESLGWEVIESKLKQYPFMVLYVGDATESYEQKVTFIEETSSWPSKVAVVMVRPERIGGGDEKRKILDDNLTINSCYIITTRKSLLVGSFDYMVEKSTTKEGVYLYKFMKNSCVVNQLEEFKGFFTFGDGKTVLDNYQRNKDVIEYYEEENKSNDQSKRDSATVKSVVNGVGGFIGRIFKKSTSVCINSTSIFWKPYQRNFSDGIGVVSNSRTTNLMLSEQIYLGYFLDSALKPTLNFGIGYSFGGASLSFSRDKSRLGLLNDEDRFPVLITDKVQSNVKSRALVFPAELGMEWRGRRENGHLGFFSAIGWWTVLQQLSMGDMKQETSDLFILDSNSGMEIRDVNLLNQFSQSSIANEENQFGINAFANIKAGLSYVSKRFSCSMSYSFFKSIVNSSIDGSYIPRSGGQMRLFDESHNIGHAFGLGLSYNL